MQTSDLLLGAVMLISIRKYLNGSQDRSGGQAVSADGLCSALHDLSRLLLHSLESIAFAGPEPEMETWRERLRGLNAQLEAASGEALLEAVGEPCRLLLEEHQAWLRASQAARAAELQQMVSMLNQTVMTLSAGSRRSLGRLRQIESDLVQTSQLQDLVALKSRLANCLTYVRQETEQEREESTRNLARMSEEVQRVRDAVVTAGEIMPGRPEAEEAITTAYSRPDLARMYAAVVALDRAESIHSRFGPSAGDKIFRDFSQRVLLGLAEPKKVFRWSSFSILALVERPGPLAEVRAEMQQFSTEPMEVRLDVAGRSAILTLTNRWVVAPLPGRGSAPALIEDIESFAGCRQESLR